ncbi:MAG: ATP-dependent DNA helicase RecG [Bacteroidales bacterium]|nr:ATP-dependent DNA helicase RecG [Bacteroidales bacterium]
MAGFFDTPIEYLKGVGPKKGELLRKELKIATFGDLLEYYPFKYIDRSKFYRIAEISPNHTFIQLKGRFVKKQLLGKGKAQRLVVNFRDESGEIELIWFKGISWVTDKIRAGAEFVVFGRPTLFNSKYNIAHPEIEPLAEFVHNTKNGLEPYYNATEKGKTKGIDSKLIARLTKNLVLMLDGSFTETLIPEILNKYKLPSRAEAFQCIHHPPNQHQLNRARARLKYEEFFYIQLNLAMQKSVRFQKIKGNQFPIIGDYFNTFYKNHLPFELTGAQKRVLKEIRRDVGTGHQMNRLLQGDVGSGKTMVALMSMLMAVDNGFQASIMAPTEILANQHLESISEMLDGMDIQIELLTGSTRKAKRRQISEDFLSGQAKILIGTHALLEDSVQFKNLGLTVIDEQHRFGVAQRAQMWKKNSIPPHILVMTATPIPRTLAMTVYGDLDVSVIDELPPGRKAIQTYHYNDSLRQKVFGFMKKQILEGRQVYVVYPLIEESEKLDLKDLMDGFESITRAFPLPDYAVSIVHGKMKAADKDYEMQRFARGETQIMVATTVIEVGVNVPNASVMVIENAERFGLAQLHQLRGRVGRGADQSFCILMSGEKLSADGRKRIQTMVESNDGFRIAEEDLKLRGPGDLKGTQQSGMLDLKIADIIKDEKALKSAREDAFALTDKDPELMHPDNYRIAIEYREKHSKKKGWSQIS